MDRRTGHPSEPTDLPDRKIDRPAWIERREAAQRHKPKVPQEPEPGQMAGEQESQHEDR